MRHLKNPQVEGAEAKIKEMLGLGMEVAKAKNKCPTGICSLKILSKRMVLKREKHLKVEIKVMVFWIWGNIIRFFFCILMYWYVLYKYKDYNDIYNETYNAFNYMCTHLKYFILYKWIFRM